MGLNRRCAPNISLVPHQPTSTIRLATYMDQPQAIIRGYITLLLQRKDSFGVEIQRIYDWWLRYHQRCEITTLNSVYEEDTDHRRDGGWVMLDHEEFQLKNFNYISVTISTLLCEYETRMPSSTLQDFAPTRALVSQILRIR